MSVKYFQVKKICQRICSVFLFGVPLWHAGIFSSTWLFPSGLAAKGGERIITIKSSFFFPHQAPTKTAFSSLASLPLVNCFPIWRQFNSCQLESIQGVSDCKVNTDTYMWVFCDWNASQLTKLPLQANSSALAADIGVNNLKVVLKNTISDLLFLKLREAAYVHRLTDSKLVFGSNVICLCTR